MAKKQTEIDLDSIYQEYQGMSEKFDSLLMATVSEENIPNVSYAVYIRSLGNYYVFISDLAVHTGNLLHNNHVSILFIENEESAQHLFARQRTTILCNAHEVDRDIEDYGYIMQLFTDKFGGFMSLLKDKNDFHLFCLKPLSGTYVAGFGRAFTITGNDLSEISHINDIGHKSVASSA